MAMSVKEKILQELNELSPDDLLKVSDAIEKLKKAYVNKGQASERPYLKVQAALKSLQRNLSAEVILEREERL